MDTELVLQSENVSNLLTRVTTPNCKKQVYSFAQLALKKLNAAGVDESLSRSVIKNAIEEYAALCMQSNEECMSIVGETLEHFINAEDSGRDVLGRLLMHFCFERSGEHPTAHPPDSDLDELARKQFADFVLPSPLAKLFLVAVRGTLENVDRFQAPPYLFGTGHGYLDRRVEYCHRILEDYRIGDHDTEHAPTYWTGFYKDRRTLVLSLDLITETIRRLHDLGLDKLLRIFDNLLHQYTRHATDEDPAMERLFSNLDMKQICWALDAAREFLEEKAGRGILPRPPMCPDR